MTPCSSPPTKKMLGCTIVLTFLTHIISATGRPGGLQYVKGFTLEYYYSLTVLLALVLEFDSRRGEIVNLFAKMQQQKKYWW